MIKMFNTENFQVSKSFQYKIKVMKFHNAAANGKTTGTFQKCNWSQIDPTVDTKLIKTGNDHK